MAKYLITYDLNKPGQNYSDLYEAIKALGNYRHPLDSTWFVSTSKSASDIRDALKGEIDSSDKLFVTKVESWASFRMSDLADWLNS